MQLTNKQLEAIFKMEEYAGITSHRENFENKEDFQAYWDLLDKKIKKKKSFRDAVQKGLVSLVDIRKKREQNILNYYQDFSHLRVYGEKYCQKYSPSSGKLKKQLAIKCKNTDIVNKVFQDLLPLLNDEKLAFFLAQNLMRKGKDQFQVKILLSKKMFSKELIDKTIGILSKEKPMDIEDSPLPNQIRSLRKKGKSTRKILQKFRGSVYLKDDILRIINENSEDQSEEDILIKEIEKLIRKKVDHKKIIQRLLGKGFSYQDIKKNLN